VARKRNSSPAYQWYPKDILTDEDVTLMSFEVEGFYRHVLDLCWLHDGLPVDDDDRFRLVTKCKKRSEFDRLWLKVRHKFFVGRGSKLRNKRQERERTKQRKFSKKQKLAADARWEKARAKSDATAYATALPTQMPDGCFAFAFAPTDQDQPQENQRAVARRPRPARMRMVRTMADVRRHLLKACDLEIQAHPGITDLDLRERMKVIAGHDLQVDDYRDVDAIISTVRARMATEANGRRIKRREPPHRSGPNWDPDYYRKARAWREECDELHGGACGNAWAHQARMVAAAETAVGQ
jgi:uncharacterized protein YdaU (DUF1376 family)